MLKPRDQVKVKRDIYRRTVSTGKEWQEQILYSTEGEIGEVLENPCNSGAMLPKIPHQSID
jgi:hypothetical protein